MGQINRVFNGKLNLDVSPNKIPPADYSDALNITRDAQGDGQDIIVTNIPGNERVFYSLPAGQNKRNGSYSDKVRNRIYYWVWNSNGYNLWLYYDATENTIVKLVEDLTDTDNIPVLDLNPSKRINHVDIIYRDDEGDLVFFTDGHTTPKEANVKFLLEGKYSTIKTAYIELAKRPPLSSPTSVYGNDSLRTANALRRKLFMPIYRWTYDDFSKSSFSPSGKIPLPIGYYGSDNDIDNGTNNFITITVETGDENVTDIEIAVRENSGNNWLDFILVASINKTDFNIPDNSTYQFLFYNDALYPPITDGVQYLDGVQIIPLFFWVPQLADCQVMGNGNIPIYGAITEGYDQYPVSDLDVTITAENKTNIPPDADPPAITYEDIGASFVFTVSGSVPTGTTYKIYIFFNGTPPGQTFGVRLVGDYTSVPGDTTDDVAFALYNDFNSFSSVPIITGSYGGGNTWQSNFGTAGSYVFSVQVVAGAPAGDTISTEKVWMHDANYVFGQVYLDEQGRDMPGVITYSNPISTDNDYVVTTPALSLDTGDIQTPVITAEVNHLPVANSKKMNWVRRRQTYGTFLWYMTCDFQEEDGYYYFCLANIEAYKLDNSQFIYESANISDNSSIKILAGVTSTAYNGDLWTQDYQILGTVERTLTTGSAPADNKPFIKVKIPDSAPSPTYTQNMVVMVYTPSVNPSTLANSVYYEWGEGYDTYLGQTLNYSGLTGVFVAGETVTGSSSGATGIIVALDTGVLALEQVSGQFTVSETITGGTSGATATVSSISESVLYHRGMTQDQTSFQPAIYVWEEGDVYFHERLMYNSIVGAPPYTGATLSIMDASFSDFFNSAVNDNGRAQAIEVNAKNTFFPTLVRFGGAYQNDTDVNEVNTFFFESFQDIDRSNGIIRKMFIDGRRLYAFQQFDVGIIPIYTQIVLDTAGNPLEANSTELLNKVMYPYSGKFGIGDIPESFAFGKGAMYFGSDYKGTYNRLSNNGITAISVLYDCNNFFVSKLKYFNQTYNNGFGAGGQRYEGSPTVYATFNEYINRVIISLEEINRYNSQGSLIFHQEPYTVSFAETRDTTEGFESILSYHPEGLDCLNNLLVSFLNGEIWKHDSAVYCNFYGAQYNAYIQGVFNDNILEKKTWEALTQISNTKFACPVIYTNVNSYAGQRQETELIEEDFTTFEEYPSSAILRDKHSIGGLINGDTMKGGYMVIRFQKANASTFIELSGVSVLFRDSPLTSK